MTTSTYYGTYCAHCKRGQGARTLDEAYVLYEAHWKTCPNRPESGLAAIGLRLNDRFDDDERQLLALIDGLTAEQCLELYESRQRERPCPDLNASGYYFLTQAQLAVARELWSVQLRERIGASRERDRTMVSYSELDADD